MLHEGINIVALVDNVQKGENFTIDGKEYTEYNIWTLIMGGKLLIKKYVPSEKEFNLEKKKYCFPIDVKAKLSTKKEDNNGNKLPYVIYKSTKEPILINE